MKEKKLQVRHEGYIPSKQIILSCVPLLIMATYFYGARVITLAGVSVLTAIICDRIALYMMNKPYDKTEISSIAHALILTLMFSPSVDYSILIFSVAVAIFIGKYVFGGWNCYIFNPSALGFIIATVSWPDAIFKYQTPFTAMGSALVNSPSYTLKMNGLPNISLLNLMLGNYPDAMGISATLVIIACGVYLVITRRVSSMLSLSFVSSCAVIAYLFPRAQMVTGFDSLKYEILCGNIIFAAVFLLSDLTTLPKNKYARVAFGIILGFMTMMFRYFGFYEQGMCFALILLNACAGYFDRMAMNISMKCKGVKA